MADLETEKMAPVEGIEPPPTGLAAVVQPLHQTGLCFRKRLRGRRRHSGRGSIDSNHRFSPVALMFRMLSERVHSKLYNVSGPFRQAGVSVDFSTVMAAPTRCEAAQREQAATHARILSFGTGGGTPGDQCTLWRGSHRRWAAAEGRSSTLPNRNSFAPGHALAGTCRGWPPVPELGPRPSSARP